MGPYFLDTQYIPFIKANHAEATRFACELCDYTTGRKDLLKHHHESKHDSVAYPCDQCQYVGKNARGLKKHKETNHEGRALQCNTCDFVTNKELNLKRHIESKHELIRYPCDQCEYAAKRLDYLKHHKKTKHPHADIKEEPYPEYNEYNDGIHEPLVQFDCDEEEEEGEQNSFELSISPVKAEPWSDLGYPPGTNIC